MCVNTPLPKVCIIVLNWNGWRDTIECLESVQQLDYPNYLTVVVDNGSDDDSLERIQAWAEGKKTVESRYVNYCQHTKPVTVISYNTIAVETSDGSQLDQVLKSLPTSKMIVLIRSGENLGFARGCNVGIRYAMDVNTDYIWLLNNDTVVEPGSLKRLVNFMQCQPDFQGVTGQIRLYHRPSAIWNCGGLLTWYGARRYDYAGAPVVDVPQWGFKRISFITGCAALFRTAIFGKVGLLSERFFFGEEDFELSQRLKRMGYKLACCYEAVIYHKVSASMPEDTRIGRTFIYYLNRFIDLRQYWPEPVWYVWRLVYMLYILPMLRLRYKFSLRTLWLLCRALLRDSLDLDRVDRDTFEYALKFRFNQEPG